MRPLGGSPSEYCCNFWYRKTRMMLLPDSENAPHLWYPPFYTSAVRLMEMVRPPLVDRSGALQFSSRVLRPSLVTLCSHKSGRCAVELYHAPHPWYPPFYTSPMASSALQYWTASPTKEGCHWQAGGENRQTWQLANPVWYPQRTTAIIDNQEKFGFSLSTKQLSRPKRLPLCPENQCWCDMF